MSADSRRLVFAGTPEFASTHLAALLQKGYNVVAVYTQPDRPAGRGKQPQPSPVKTLALAHGIPVYQPLSLKEPEQQAILAALQPDLMVVVAYGLLLPQAILDTPRLGCINVHASLLPRWRGAAPIQRAIEAGDTESGVCIMQMEAGLDTGPVLHARSCPVLPDDTGGSLHDRLATTGAQALVDTLPTLFAGQLVATPQATTGVCYAHKLSKEDGHLDFSLPARALANKVRAFNPFPVSWCVLPQGEHLRIWVAEVQAGNPGAAPGCITALSPDGLSIACGEDTLRVKELQLPNRKRMAVRDLLNGHHLALAPGDVLA